MSWKDIKEITIGKWKTIDLMKMKIDNRKDFIYNGRIGKFDERKKKFIEFAVFSIQASNINELKKELKKEGYK